MAGLQPASNNLLATMGMGKRLTISIFLLLCFHNLVALSSSAHSLLVPGRLLEILGERLLSGGHILGGTSFLEWMAFVIRRCVVQRSF